MNKVIGLTEGPWKVTEGYGGVILKYPTGKEVLLYLLEPGIVFSVAPGQVIRYYSNLKFTITREQPTTEPLIERIRFLSLPIYERIEQEAERLELLANEGVYIIHIAQYLGCAREYVSRYFSSGKARKIAPAQQSAEVSTWIRQ